MSFNRTQRHQTVAGGISVGSEEVTAGTVTGKFTDLTDNSIVLVSNRHVLEGRPGSTQVLQPGLYDGGKKPGDVIGVVKRLAPYGLKKPLPWWKKIICLFLGWILEEWCYEQVEPARLDAGASTWNPSDPNRKLDSGVYLDNGKIIKPAKTHPGDGIVGRRVWKSGRTTGVTVGQVVDDKAEVKVWYGDYWILYNDVVIVQGTSKPGDSGSPVFLLENVAPSDRDPLCGILFAGSSAYFVFCKYKYLEDMLKVRWSP